MKKVLLIIGLFAGALGMSAQAQVFSANAVGYVNVQLSPGFNAVANPLLAPDNSIGALFKNIQGGVPDGTRVYRFIGDRFISAQWNDLDGEFIPAPNAAQIILPGDGVFLWLPGSDARTLTFVGEIEQGTVCTDIPHGLSLKGNIVPQTAQLDNPVIGLPAGPGDILYVFNRVTQAFNMYTYDDLDKTWMPNSPIIAVGEAFFLYHKGPDTNWCRTFFVNAQ